MEERPVNREQLVQGIGFLMGLCPEPERWQMLELCEPFHLLPSRLEPKDLEWLEDYRDMKWCKETLARVNEVVAGHGTMPCKVVQYLLDLCNEAEEKWRTSD